MIKTCHPDSVVIIFPSLSAVTMSSAGEKVDIFLVKQGLACASGEKLGNVKLKVSCFETLGIMYPRVKVLELPCRSHKRALEVIQDL